MPLMSDEPEDESSPWWQAPVTIVLLAWCASLVLAGVTLATFAAKLHWVFELTCHFALQYAWAAAALLLAFSITRKKWGVLVAGLLLLIHGVPLVGVYFDGEHTPLSDHRPVRVLLANVHTANTQHDELPLLIELEQPDVVLLIEVNSLWLEALDSLASTHPHAISIPRADNFGIALFSRLPFVGASAIDLGAADVPSLEAHFDIDGSPLHIVLTHPVPPGAWGTRERDVQLRHAAEHARGLGARTVLAGDLNITPWSPMFREMLTISGMRDSRKGFGVHPTWISQMPAALRIPIDHVLTSPDIAVVDCRVGPHIGSDHRPLIVDVR